MWVLLNGGLVPEAEARVSVFDRGFTYGDGLFETVRVYSGTAFALREHLDRLFGAAGELRIGVPRTREEIAADIAAVLGKNGLREAVVRLQLTRGVGGRGPHLPEPASPTWVVAAWPLAADLGDRHRRGARIATVATRRLHPATLPPSAKLGNYLNSVLAAAEASERGSDEAVMLTTSGLLAEGAGANLFMVVGDGGLRTPGLHLGVLPGITRGIVLGLARDAGLAAEEGEYTAGALESAAEIFLTNSVLGIWPVCDADGRSRPCPGPVTRVLMEAYRAAVRRATGGDHPVPPLA